MSKSVKRTDDTTGSLPQTTAMSKKHKTIKAAVFTAVVYPREDMDTQKAYETFIERMNATTSDVCFILHDKDKDDDGKIKKPHIHILKRFKKAVTDTYCLEWLKRSVGDAITETTVNAIQVCEVPEEYEKYLIHSDGGDVGTYRDDGKFRYNPAQRVTLGKIRSLTYSDFIMVVMASENFKGLVEMCKEDDDLSKLLVKHSYFAMTYYKEVRQNGHNAV